HPSSSLSSSNMVYQHPMFTHRICCCSATVASQVMACIAIILSALIAVGNWLSDDPIYLNIYQTILVATEIIACVLVFVACCTLRPAFVLPIIIIQVWNTISILGTAIWFFIDVWTILTAWGVVYYICLYAFSILISLFVLHCHTCCYKVLVFKHHAAHHHHAGAAAYA
ncbi:hypothetical protein PMAYCL1PPCAC_17142, partial [Pristionchus mayeri]